MHQATATQAILASIIVGFGAVMGFLIYNRTIEFHQSFTFHRLQFNVKTVIINASLMCILFIGLLTNNQTGLFSLSIPPPLSISHH